jgi:hypothetical protein
MKRLAVLLVGFGFILTNLTAAHAWIWGKPKTEAPAAKEAAPAAAPVKAKPAEAAKPIVESQSDKARDEALKAKRAIAIKKMNELNNTEWVVEMSSMNNAKAKKEMDTVTFKDNQVSIANYSKKGFPTTNFTLTVQEDGTVIWETMQTSEKSGIAFWRGEFDPKLQTMRGVVSYQLDSKNKQDYSFVSSSKKNIPANPK